MILNVFSVHHFQTVFDEFLKVGISGPVLGVQIQDPVLFLSLDLGSALGFFPDPESGISDPRSKPYFREPSDNFLGLKYYNSLRIG
jgi:hypothetical protein